MQSEFLPGPGLASCSALRRTRLLGAALILGLPLMGAPHARAQQTAPPVPGLGNPPDMDTGDQAEMQPMPSLAPAPPATQPPALFTTRPMKLVGLIDRNVVGPNKEQVGRVIDVLLDDGAHPAALVVDVGGFMGVGNRRIAIAWDMLEPASLLSADGLQIRMKSDDIRAAPAYTADSRDVQVVQSPPPPPPPKKDVAAPPPAVTVRPMPVAAAVAPTLPVAPADMTPAPPAQPAMPEVSPPSVEGPHADAAPPVGVPASHGYMSR